MRKTTTTLAVLAAIVTVMVPKGADAQRRSEAETGLVGVKLFDTGLRLLDLYGEPDEIQGVGPGAAAPGPGAGAPPAGPAGPSAAGGQSPRRGGSGSSNLDFTNPFGFGDDVLNARQVDPNNPAGLPPAARGGQGGRPGGQPSIPGNGLPPVGSSGAGGSGNVPTATPIAPAPTAPAANSSGSSGIYNRWIYRRNTGKYGFVIDPSNRIVQIEAIGLEDSRVRTRKGLSFGSTFITTVKTYGWPDSYEVSGNTITLRYLLRNKVVFRLNRLGVDKPHQITGILVAAAKG